MSVASQDMVYRQNNVAHLLQQKLDEAVGPVRESTAVLEKADAETKQTIARMQAELAEGSTRYRELEAKIKTMEALANRPALTTADERDQKKRESKSAFNKALRFGWGRLNEDERKYVQHDTQYNLSSGENMGHGQGDEFKALYGSDATTGGFLMTSEYNNELIEAIVLISDMHSLVEVRMTNKPFVMTPKRTQTASASRVAEQATRAETQNPKFGLVQTFPYESYALALISRQDMDDSELDLGQFITNEFSQQFAKLEGYEIINGLGAAASQCFGFLSDPAINNNGSGTITTTASGVIDYPSLTKLRSSLKQGYRKGSTWVMTTETVGNLQSLTDNQSRPLWTPFGAAQPDTLFGYPIVEMPDMPQMAANGGSAGALAIAYGNFKLAYQLVIRKQVSVQMLQERYADQNAVGYMGYYRFGGTTKLPEAVKTLRVHV